MIMSKTDLYRKYQISASVYQNPIIYGVIILFVLLIDFFTTRITVDGLFSSSTQNVNLLVTISICIILDVLPLGMTKSLEEISDKHRRRVGLCVMAAGFSVVFVTIIFMGIERCLSAGLLFGDEVLTDFSAVEISSEPEAYQIIIVIVLTLVNVGTSLFGVLITLERSKVQKKINYALNCEELEDCKAELVRLQQPSRYLDELNAEFEALNKTIDSIAEEAAARAELLIALSFDPRTVSKASNMKEDELP